MAAERKKGKNPHGTGGINTVNGIDYWRISYEDRQTGRSKQKRFKIDYTQKRPLDKAKADARKWKDEYYAGMLPEASKITVKQWLDKYIATYVVPHTTPKSVDGYRDTARKVIQRIGDIKLHSLRVEMIDNLFNELLLINSPMTVNVDRTRLKTMFKRAVTNGYLLKNLIEDTKPIKKPKQSKIKAMTEEQAKKLLQVAKENDHMSYIAIMLGLKCGLRTSEVFGLRWQDIDIEKRTLTICNSLTISTKGFREGLPKDGEIRTLEIDSETTKKLKEWKKKQSWFINSVGDKWVNENRVCHNVFGGAMHTGNFEKRNYKRLLKIAEIGDWTFHELRHTFATTLLLRGVPVTIVSNMMGHAKTSTTLDNYAHLLPNSQSQAINVISEIFANT